MAAGVMIHVDSAIRWILAEEAEELDREKRRFLLHAVLVLVGAAIGFGCGFALIPAQWVGFIGVTETARVGIDHRTEYARAAAAARSERSHYD